MATRQKGSAFENEVKKVMENQGWVVEKAYAKTVWLGPKRPISLSHDFFGAWDLIGKKVGEKTQWIQVSTWEHLADKRKQVVDFPWTKEFDEPQIWGRLSGRNAHFRVCYGRDGYEWKGTTQMVNSNE